MAVAAHLKELENKHARLEAKIKEELKHPLPDASRISTLKKQKLQLKEQIHTYR